jgi:type III secretion protein J
MRTPLADARGSATTNRNRAATVRERFKLLPLIAITLLLCSCTKELETGLSQQEAQEIVVLLKENGIDAVSGVAATADKNAPPTWAVKVKGGGQNLALAWRILQDNGLPRQKVKGLEEVFSTTGMIPTASEEKARLLMALSGELSRMLKSVEGVVDARVQVVLPENSPLLDKSQWSPTTAAVLLKYRGARTPLSEDEVKKLVARGVEGLQPENVGVVFKKIEPVRQPQRDVAWYLGDQQVVMASVALMTLASLGSLLLVFRSRRQRAAIEQLRRQLQAERPQLTA